MNALEEWRGNRDRPIKKVNLSRLEMHVNIEINQVAEGIQGFFLQVQGEERGESITTKKGGDPSITTKKGGDPSITTKKDGDHCIFTDSLEPLQPKSPSIVQARFNELLRQAQERNPHKSATVGMIWHIKAPEQKNEIFELRQMDENGAYISQLRIFFNNQNGSLRHLLELLSKDKKNGLLNEILMQYGSSFSDTDKEKLANLLQGLDIPELAIEGDELFEKVPAPADPPKPPKTPEQTAKPEKLNATPELILLPQGVEGVGINDGISPAKNLMDNITHQEAPGNPQVIAVDGGYALVRTTTNGRNTYKVISGPFNRAEGYKPLETLTDEVKEEIEKDPYGFIDKVMGNMKEIVLDYPQGHLSLGLNNKRIRNGDLAYEALMPITGAMPFMNIDGEYKSNRHQMPILYQQLDKFSSVLRRNTDTLGIVITYNPQGQIIIQGAGSIQSGDLAFALVLDRTAMTDQLARYLSTTDISKESKLALLGKLFLQKNQEQKIESTNSLFPLTRGDNLVVIDRTGLPRGVYDHDQVNSTKSSEQLSFFVSDLADAVAAQVALLNQKMKNAKVIFEQSSDTHIDLSQVDEALLRSVHDAILRKHLMSWHPTPQLKAQTDSYATYEEIYHHNDQGTELVVNEFDGDNFYLLFHIREPDIFNYKEPKSYDMRNPHNIYAIPSNPNIMIVLGQKITSLTTLDNVPINNIRIPASTLLDCAFMGTSHTRVTIKGKASPHTWKNNLEAFLRTKYQGLLILGENTGNDLKEVKLSMDDGNPSFTILFGNLQVAQQFANNNPFMRVAVKDADGQTKYIKPTPIAKVLFKIKKLGGKR